MKKKILFVATRPPFPLLSGEKNKAFNEIKILSKKYEIIYCGLCPRKDREDVLNLLSPYCLEVHLFKMDLIFSLLKALYATFTGLPLQIAYFTSEEMKRFIEDKSTEVDGVFLNLFRAVQYVVDVKKTMYLDMSDSISEHYKAAVKVTSSPFWKIIYSIESKRMREYEDKYLHLFKKVFLYNPVEVKLYHTENLKWIPHGVNENVINYEAPVEIEKKDVVSFLGKMDYRPNIEAVKWFVYNVLPSLDKRFTFKIIGAFPTKEVIELQENSRVEVTGFVDDPYLLLKESICVVAPMVSGGGIQNKLLESMALGCVNIVSSLCAKPLIDLRGEIIIEDDPKRIAETINELNRDSLVYKQYSVSSRAYILKNYTWEKYAKILFEEVDV